MEKFYTLPEIADILRCSVPTIRRRIKAGTLRAVKNGGVYLISESALNSYLQTSETSVNDIPATSTDAPPQPTESPTTGDKATLETDAQQPEPTTEKPSSVLSLIETLLEEQESQT